ncbi:MAG: carbon monoxide dehydrogenase-like protein, corrinoid/iron-sulfur protein [Firmicutes bacterium]|nr:carbon monoxide dehydrogenase-like protein, corrinoid/iron-sulfur protein [Bacillota bacterium]
MGYKKEPETGACWCCTASSNSETSCCDQMSLSGISKTGTPWISGEVATAIGKIPRVSTQLTLRDRAGSWKARWGIGRMDYKVPPGLYAIGNPDASSLVLVSANYKMSFDRLRCEMEGLNLWILVIDTKGINVWCAAGKGTFGTEELVNRIAQVNLTEVVAHRTLILPQLSAPGVAAHQVLKLSGFKVRYGPVRAADVPAYISSGLEATRTMREVRFDMLERLVLTPFELVGTIKPALILIALLMVLNLLLGKATSMLSLIHYTVADFVPFFGAILTGAVVVPLLLPYIPGRAFAWKGWLMGLLWAGVYIGLIASPVSWILGLFYLLILPPISSFLAMNFTGCSTYTSLSGVVKEMKFAVPVQIISAVAGIVLMVGGLFVAYF